MSSPSPDDVRERVNHPETIRARLHTTTIPVAKMSLETAKSLIGNIQTGKVVPKEMNITAMKIVSSGKQVVDVVRDISVVYQLGQDSVTYYASFIKLESDRRDDSNQQIAVVCYAMSSVMFELHHLVPYEYLRDDLRDNLEYLLQRMEESMKEFGAYSQMCYKHKSMLAVMRASQLKGRLLQFWDEFTGHRQEFAQFFGIQMSAPAVDFRRIVDQVGQSNPKEKKAAEFIRKNGGPERVMDDPKLLDQVAKILGEKINGQLRSALHQDLSELLEDNKRAFEFKIEGATEQIKDALQYSQDAILRRLDEGPHELIKDEDIKKIWKDNQWRTSVKSRMFMDAVHDFYEPRVRQQMQEAGTNHPDEWTLPFLNKFMYRPAIADAIDADGSGYISVDECNDFIESRPPGWTVPQWLAFWAIVWLMNNDDYRIKIETLTSEIKDLASKAQRSNKKAIDDYLTWLGYIDPIVLQSLDWGVAENTPVALNTDDLYRVQELYKTHEETKLRAKLQGTEYYIEDEATLAIITGQDRIELAIMPLLYLILQYQRTVIEKATKQDLDQSEFERLSDTLNEVLMRFDCRLDDLERGWKQQRMDVDVQVACFAGGIFSGWYVKRKSPPKELVDLLDYWNGTDSDDDDDDDDTDTAAVEVTLDSLNERVNGVETRLGNIESLLQALAQKFGIDPSVLQQGAQQQQKAAAADAAKSEAGDSEQQDGGQEQQEDGQEPQQEPQERGDDEDNYGGGNYGGGDYGGGDYGGSNDGGSNDGGSNYGGGNDDDY